MDLPTPRACPLCPVPPTGTIHLGPDAFRILPCQHLAAAMLTTWVADATDPSARHHAKTEAFLTREEADAWRSVVLNS